MSISIPTNYDYWVKPIESYSHEQFQESVYTPQDVISPENPLTFNIHGNDKYIAVSRVYLYIRGKIVKRVNNADVDLTAQEDNSVAICNNMLHSIIKQVKFILNDVDIISSNNSYAHKAFYENVLSSDFYKEKNTLALMGFFNERGLTSATDAAGNTNFEARAALTNGGKMLELQGNLNIDFFKQNNHIPPGQKIQIMIYQNTPQFMLQTKSNIFAATNPYFKIFEAKLLVRHETLAPSMALSHLSNWNKEPISFRYETTSTKIINIAAGVSNFSYDSLFMGKIPKILYISFIKTPDLTGLYTTNPFWSSPEKSLTQISIYKNGSLVGRQTPLLLNLKDDNIRVKEAYRKLIEGVHGDASKGFYFSAEDFRKRGFFIYLVDLRAQIDPQNDSNVNETGNISITLHYSKPTTINYEMLVTGIFNVETKITASHETIHTFTG